MIKTMKQTLINFTALLVLIHNGTPCLSVKHDQVHHNMWPVTGSCETLHWFPSFLTVRIPSGFVLTRYNGTFTVFLQLPDKVRLQESVYSMTWFHWVSIPLLSAVNVIAC